MSLKPKRTLSVTPAELVKQNRDVESTLFFLANETNESQGSIPYRIALTPTKGPGKGMTFEVRFRNTELFVRFTRALIEDQTAFLETILTLANAHHDGESHPVLLLEVQWATRKRRTLEIELSLFNQHAVEIRLL